MKVYKCRHCSSIYRYDDNDISYGCIAPQGSRFKRIYCKCFGELIKAMKHKEHHDEFDWQDAFKNEEVFISLNTPLGKVLYG